MKSLNDVRRCAVYGIAQRARHGVYAATRFWAMLGLSLSLAGASAYACAETDLSDITYRLGDGLAIPGSGLTLGGYSTVSLERARHTPARLGLDNTSLIIWWEAQRWKFLSELDYENLLSSRSAHRPEENRYLALERLYFDYAATDTSTLRAGKFLTPIGHWNLIHATPLVWTVSRPLVTNQVFPTNVTGLMINGSLPSVAEGLEYSFYGSNGVELRPNPALDPFYEAIGGHLTIPVATQGQLGFSYASFEQKKTLNERKQLLGFDFVWSQNRYEFSAEGVYRFSNNGSIWDEKGGFLQLVAPLTEKLYAVGRYEFMRIAQEPKATQLWVLGLNYRITSAIVLKAEWIGSKNNQIYAPEGFMSSASVLF